MTKKQKETILEEFNEDGVNINGCHIKGNTVYTIVPKVPSKAPEVYLNQLQSEKERMPGVSNTKTFPTIRGMVNNGFHPQSQVFDDMSITNYEEREKQAEKFEVIFLEPIKFMMEEEEYEKFKKPRAYELYETEKFAEIVNVNIRDYRQFNTANPLDRFHLYIAALTNGIVEKGKRTTEERQKGYLDENATRTAQYAYVSQDKVKTNKETASVEKLKASTYFSELLLEDRNLLIDMMNFNFPVNMTKKDDSDTLLFKFDQGIISHLDSRGKVKRFISEYKDYKESPDRYKKILEVYETLQKDGDAVLTDKREVKIGGRLLPNIKTAARTIAGEAELYKEFYELIE